ncbi:YkgB family protein [Microtetraspora malaysiensis]|uniref:YkgB family protein n=1 Tax=Microtetraspora malaysiensis TaxID=161358 RepID=UPI003D8F4AE9
MAVALERAGGRISVAGRAVSRYGLVVVLAWIGAGKYVKMESRTLIEHSPLMSWLYDFFSYAMVAYSLGTVEIVTAVLIAVHPRWPRVSAIGSAIAVVLFLGTLSFLFTTPGVVQTVVNGLPVLSGLPGQFLLKDLVLIGVALWTLGESLESARVRRVGDASPRSRSFARHP